MSGPTVEVVANDVKHIQEDIKDLTEKVAFLLRWFFWLSGACAVIGAAGAYAIPVMFKMAGVG